MSRSDDASPPDHYAQLGVQPSASAGEIRAAYRKKARETHPDHNPDDPKAAERFQTIKEAYQVLRDPDRRESYDRARTTPRAPEVLRITQQAPAGCGGYLWRVFAGLAAVGVFFVLEALGVWAADVWTLALAVGGGALVAGLLTALVARRFPDEATDVSLRLDAQRFQLRADGRTVVRLAWDRVDQVGVRNGGPMVMRVDPGAVEGLRPVPPVLTTVNRRGNGTVLRFDLSGTDVPRSVLVSFLRATDSIPASSKDA
ncbi:J domain-containing protein [Salinibacter altiplanensis]|uniref:J domain-containing protein n=1 Tax=Salinibacter altiplanensis TaxID=1803181 RepID=UPI000C9F8C17|nr:DnaJ domain-containing protein [Salinibacter altiplanensis]